MRKLRHSYDYAIFIQSDSGEITGISQIIQKAQPPFFEICFSVNSKLYQTLNSQLASGKVSEIDDFDWLTYLAYYFVKTSKLP